MRRQKSLVSAQEPSRRAAPAHQSRTEGGNGQPTHERISQRAYDIYLARGTAGDAVADWLEAERELAERD